MLCSSSDCCLCGLRICWTICAWKVDQINFASGISGSCVSLNSMSRTRLQFHTRERGARRLAEPQNSQRPKGSSTEVHPTRAFSLDNRAEARKTQQIVMPGRGIVVACYPKSTRKRQDHGNTSSPTRSACWVCFQPCTSLSPKNIYPQPRNETPKSLLNIRCVLQRVALSRLSPEQFPGTAALRTARLKHPGA